MVVFLSSGREICFIFLLKYQALPVEKSFKAGLFKLSICPRGRAVGEARLETNT